MADLAWGADALMAAATQTDNLQWQMCEGQKNDGPVMSFDTAVGIAVRGDLDAETVYKITKALNVEFAASKRGLMELKPGAVRYYGEAGIIE
ncbi:MAG: hypothetical protein QNJ20_13565 [Paracoccaceae bacterium]|nr:hypothetical protein [Paracoccaceae bacterium]